MPPPFPGRPFFRIFCGFSDVFSETGHSQGVSPQGDSGVVACCPQGTTAAESFGPNARFLREKARYCR